MLQQSRLGPNCIWSLGSKHRRPPTASAAPCTSHWGVLARACLPAADPFPGPVANRTHRGTPVPRSGQSQRREPRPQVAQRLLAGNAEPELQPCDAPAAARQAGLRSIQACLDGLRRLPLGPSKGPSTRFCDSLDEFCLKEDVHRRRKGRDPQLQGRDSRPTPVDFRLFLFLCSHVTRAMRRGALWAVAALCLVQAAQVQPATHGHGLHAK